MKTFEDTKISLATAKLAKEKKFDAIVKGSITEYLNTKIDREYPEGGGPFGWKKGELEGDDGYFRNFDEGADYSNKNFIMYARPTQSVLQRWLREVHNIQVYCYSHTKNGNGVYRDYVVRVNETPINDARDEEFQTYEEAMEIGLQHALEMI
jgi:hypothetical protein